jgi:hypothetical protein
MEVVASIVAFLQLSGKVTTYIQTASGAKADRKRLRDAIRACGDVLQDFKDEIDTSEAGKAWVDRIEGLCRSGGALFHLQTALNLVETRLQQDGTGKVLK